MSRNASILHHPSVRHHQRVSVASPAAESLSDAIHKASVFLAIARRRYRSEINPDVSDALDEAQSALSRAGRSSYVV